MHLRHLLPLLLLLGFGHTLGAQDYRVVETSTLMDKNTMNVAAVDIDAPRDRVEEVLIDYLENRFGIDMDRQDKDKRYVTWQADQVEITDLNNGLIDLWAKVAATGDTRTSVMLAASRGYDNSINSANDDRGYRNLEMITDNFARHFYQTYYNEQLEEKTEAVKEMADKREDLTKETAKLSEDIVDKEQEIEKLRREIEENRQQITNNEAQLRDLEPQLDELQNEQSKMRDKTQRWGEPTDPKKIRKRRKRTK